jgi:hypothetical protein
MELVSVCTQTPIFTPKESTQTPNCDFSKPFIAELVELDPIPVNIAFSVPNELPKTPTCETYAKKSFIQEVTLDSGPVQIVSSFPLPPDFLAYIAKMSRTESPRPPTPPELKKK